MTAPGETNLAAMLASLGVERRPGEFGFVETTAGGPAPQSAMAMVHEGDRVSWIVPLPHPGAVFPAVWLTLTVDSSLEAVGLTAVFAPILAKRGIPANILAGVRHDHLLVPADRADEAIDVLRSLRRSRDR